MAFDAYLKIEGVEGEVTTTGFEKQIEIYSFSWGASNPTTVGSSGTGLTAGKASLSSFNVMKKTDKASPTLFQACCSGKHYDKATLTMRKSGGESAVSYLVYEFGGVLVESIQWSGSTGGDDTPTESLSLAYARVKITYTPQDEKGLKKGEAVIGSWDLTKVAMK